MHGFEDKMHEFEEELHEVEDLAIAAGVSPEALKRAEARGKDHAHQKVGSTNQGPAYIDYFLIWKVGSTNQGIKSNHGPNEDTDGCEARCGELRNRLAGLEAELADANARAAKAEEVPNPHPSPNPNPHPSPNPNPNPKS